jgi:hypothetical protein
MCARPRGGIDEGIRCAREKRQAAAAHAARAGSNLRKEKYEVEKMKAGDW